METGNGKDTKEPAQQPVKEVAPSPEEQALTRKDAEALISEALSKQKTEHDKIVAGLNRSLSGKDKKLKELESHKPSYNADALEMVIKAVKGEMPVDQAEAALAKLREQQNTQQQQDEVRRIVDGKREEDRAKIVAAGLDPNDKMFREYRRDFKQSLMDGDFSLSDETLQDTIESVKAKPEPKVEPKVLSEDDEAEIARKWMEKQGLLTTHISAPSKAFKNDQAIIDAYARGEVTDEQYKSACQRMGLL